MVSPVKTIWSGIDVSQSRPFYEASQAELLCRLWQDADLQHQLFDDPKSFLEKEAGLTLPQDTTIEVLSEDVDDTFYFIVPFKPASPQEQRLRLEQMANWWMTAHAFWWHLYLHHPEADRFRQALQAMIIGHVWSDPAFRQGLLTNPKETLEREIGLSFAAALQFKTLEDTANFCRLVVPNQPNYTLLQGPNRLSDWWMTAHTFWAWLIWPQIHAPIAR
jgi:hypothetical protein